MNMSSRQRQYPAVASASSSPALVFKSAGGLKARSMNSLMAATAAAAEREREREREQLRGPFTLRVLYSEGSELSEFRLGKKRTLPRVPPSPPSPPPLPLPPLPQAVLPAAVEFECECGDEAEGGGGGEVSYKSLTPSQFEEHVKALTEKDSNNNSNSKSQKSDKETDANQKHRSVQRNTT